MHENLRYAAAALGPRDATELVELARRQAGIASNRAEEALLRAAAAWFISEASAAHAARYAALGTALATHLRDGAAFDLTLLGGLRPADELDAAAAKTAGLVLRQAAAGPRGTMTILPRD